MARIEDDVFARVVETRFVPANLSLATQEPVLVATLTVAWVQCDRLVHVLLVSRGVQTHLTGRRVGSQVSNFAGSDCFSRNKQLGVHVFDVPAEGMALQPFSKLFPITHIPVIALRCDTGSDIEEEEENHQHIQRLLEQGMQGAKTGTPFPHSVTP